MAERLLFVQNADFERPGWLEDWARSRGFDVSLCRPRDEGLPAPPSRVIVLGAPESVRDLAKLPWLEREADWLRRAIAGGTRVLGVCLGAQLVAHLLGGEVKDGAYAEIGWLPFEWRGERFPLFQWHREIFTLPPGAEPFGGEPLRGFRLGAVWALGGHPEITPELAREFVRRCWSESWYAAQTDTRFVQRPEVLERTADAACAAGRSGITALLDEWAK